MWNFMKGVALGSIEEVPHNLIKKSKDYEEREYPSAKWATVTREAPAKDPISREMFMTLFAYISGENELGVDLSMTKPIVTRVTPGNPNNTYKMSIHLSKLYRDNPPKPKNPEVTVEEWPQKSVVVRSFGGYAKDASTTTEKQLLVDSLKNDENESMATTDGAFYQVVYDPPFKMLGRRNEIWFDKMIQ